MWNPLLEFMINYLSARTGIDPDKLWDMLDRIMKFAKEKKGKEIDWITAYLILVKILGGNVYIGDSDKPI